jgi:hypothetical protein
MGEIFILRDDLKMEEVDYEVRGGIISIIPHTEIFIQWQGKDNYSKFLSNDIISII